MEELHQPIEQSTDTLPRKITKEDFSHLEMSRKSKILYWIKTILLLCISSFLISFATYSLIKPNRFTIGGAGGIAILVNIISEGRIPQSAVIFAINLPLVLVSFFFVKRRFAVLTTANIGLQTLWLILLENVFPIQIAFESNGEKIFAAIAAGILMGTAIALGFKIGGSTGGADIAAVMIQRKFAATSIAWVLLIINCTIIGSSIFVFPGDTPALTLLPIMMATFESYVETRTNDAITNGFHSAIEFRIITDKPEEMANALMRSLSRGVTSIPATGMYTKVTHTMLVCVVSKRQVATLRRIMKAVDPDSFAVMSAVSQVLGLGFYTHEL